MGLNEQQRRDTLLIAVSDGETVGGRAVDRSVV
jgi:hypothetical protein